MSVASLIRLTVAPESIITLTRVLPISTLQDGRFEVFLDFTEYKYSSLSASRRSSTLISSVTFITQSGFGGFVLQICEKWPNNFLT